MERFYKHEAPPEKPCFHRRNARFEASGCFSRTELLKVAKDKDLTILCRESRYSAANHLCYFNARESLERRFAVRGEGIEIAE